VFKKNILMNLLFNIGSKNGDEKVFKKNNRGYEFKGKQIKNVKDLYKVYQEESKETKEVINKLTDSVK